MKKKAFLLLGVLVVLLLASGLLLATPPSRAQMAPQAAPAVAFCSSNYCLDWQVLAGGIGPMESSSYRLQGTLGQTMAGLFDGATFELQAGYWVGIHPGEFDIYLPTVWK